jgi:DNA polymerase-4
LIGIGVQQLAERSDDKASDLWDEGAGKRARAERAMDAIRGRYGPKGVTLGTTFSGKRRDENRSG